MLNVTPNDSSNENQKVRALLVIAQSQNTLSNSALAALLEIYNKKISRTAKYFANKFYLNPDDLISEGNQALIEASKTFDLSLGVPFWGYARFKVETFIRKFIRVELKHRSILNVELETMNLDFKNELLTESIFKIIEQFIHEPSAILSGLQQEILYERFYEGTQMTQIAQSRKCSRNNVQKIVASGLKKIKIEILKNINNN